MHKYDVMRAIIVRFIFTWTILVHPFKVLNKGVIEELFYGRGMRGFLVGRISFRIDRINATDPDRYSRDVLRICTTA